MVNNTYMGVVFVVLTGLFGHAWHGIDYTGVAVKAGIERAGTALGMIGTTVFITSFLTPIIIARIADGYGWSAVAMLTFAALLCFIPFSNRSKF